MVESCRLFRMQGFALSPTAAPRRSLSARSAFVWACWASLALPVSQAQPRAAEVACRALPRGHACTYAVHAASDASDDAGSAISVASARVQGHCYEVPRGSDGSLDAAMLQLVLMCLHDNKPVDLFTEVIGLGEDNSTQLLDQIGRIVDWMVDDGGWLMLLLGCATLCFLVCVCTCIAVRCLTEEEGAMGHIRVEYHGAPTWDPWQWGWGGAARRGPKRRTQAPSKAAKAQWFCMDARMASGLVGKTAQRSRDKKAVGRPRPPPKAKTRTASVGDSRPSKAEKKGGIDIDQELRDAGLVPEDDGEDLEAPAADSRIRAAAPRVARDASGRRYGAPSRLRPAVAPSPLALPEEAPLTVPRLAGPPAPSTPVHSPAGEAPRMLPGASQWREARVDFGGALDALDVLRTMSRDDGPGAAPASSPAPAGAVADAGSVSHRSCPNTADDSKGDTASTDASETPRSGSTSSGADRRSRSAPPAAAGAAAARAAAATAAAPVRSKWDAMEDDLLESLDDDGAARAVLSRNLGSSSFTDTVNEGSRRPRSNSGSAAARCSSAGGKVRAQTPRPSKWAVQQAKTPRGVRPPNMGGTAKQEPE